MMFFDTYDQNGDGAAFLFKLDPASGQYSETGTSPNLGYIPNQGNYPYTRLIMSPDGKTLYFANQGLIGAADTATGLGEGYCTPCSYLTSGGFDIILGNDGTTLFADGVFLNTQFQLRSLQSANWRELFDADYVYGAALSVDNTLLFQPGTQFIDIFDVYSGSFQERVSLPQPLNGRYRALVANSKDNVLVGITGPQGNGISLIDLTSLPPAPQTDYVAEPASRSLSADPVTPSNRTRVPSPMSQHFHPGLIPPTPFPQIPENAATQSRFHLPAQKTAAK
jgi:hypothetical protein